jgi:hypothetical protein
VKFFYLLILALVPFAGWAGDLPADMDLGIPYQKEALANSLRCLETTRGDDERIARSRNFVAENLAYFGDAQAAIALLRGSRPHYHVPSGCVDAAMVFLGHGQHNAVHHLLGLALVMLTSSVNVFAGEASFTAKIMGKEPTKLMGVRSVIGLYDSLATKAGLKTIGPLAAINKV